MLILSVPKCMSYKFPTVFDWRIRRHIDVSIGRFSFRSLLACSRKTSSQSPNDKFKNTAKTIAFALKRTRVFDGRFSHSNTFSVSNIFFFFFFLLAFNVVYKNNTSTRYCIQSVRASLKP